MCRATMTDPQETSEGENPQVTNLAKVDAEAITAEMVRMHQSSAQAIEAEDLEMHQSAAARVNSQRVATRESAIAALSANDVDMQNSAAAVVRAGNVFLNGAAGAVVAGNAELNEVRVGLLASREVRAQHIDAVFVVARRVEGDVTTKLDVRGALIAGLVGGLITGMLVLLGRGLFGRK